MVTWQMLLVFALVLVLLFLFFREVLPVPITALLAAVVLTASGILTPTEGLSGFSSDATIAVLAMFVLSAGIQQTGVMEYVTRALLRVAGQRPRMQVLALGLIAGPLSGFINNTPVVGVMIPAVQRMARHANIAPSRLLMPLSHIAMLGGLLTLIGTSTNLLGNATLATLDCGAGELCERFRFFDFAPIGAAALATGIVYHFTIGHALIPDRGKGDFVERFDLKGFLAEFEVPAGAPVEGKDLEESGLFFPHGVQVVRVTRTDRRFDAPPRTFRLREGDQLLVEGSRVTLADLPERTGLVTLPEILHPLQMPNEPEEGLATAEVVVTMGSRYLGKTIAEIDFRNRYEALVLAVRHQGRMEIGPLSKTRLGPGDVLLVQATPKALERMREQPNLYVTRERSDTTYRYERMGHAIAIIVAVVALAAFEIMPIAISALAGAVAMVLVGCLKIDEFLRSIHWEIILLLAGVIPLGIALVKTGGAAVLGQGLVTLGMHLDPFWFLVVIFVATSLVTEVMSNNASVVLLVPIAVAAAIGVGIDPRPVALTVFMAASTSMLTPIGYQTNTMVYAPGNYRFRDFFRVGALLNASLALVVPWTISRIYPLLPA